MMNNSNQEIRPLTELEQLYYLREFLEACIRNYQQDLDEVKVKIKKLEVNDGKIKSRNSNTNFR